jgi:hypothetical protein
VKRAQWLALLLIPACRFGGPSADPQAYVTFDASTDAGDDVSSGADATVDAGDLEASGDEPTGPDDAMDDGASAEAEVEAASCSGTVAVCDPVHNTGCPNTLQQCDVDTSQTATPTGICVFNSGPDSGPCSVSIFTESCPPRSTCVGSTCRALCFCDGDCPTGECCGATGAPSGFRLCGACP